MGRTFTQITENKLRNKIEGIQDGDYKSLTPQIQTDLAKVEFDCENLTDDSAWGQRMSSLVGYHTLSNKLTFLGITAGGDWEHPVFFMIYWDGTKLRGYLPTGGNPWNTKTKQAYGNDEDADTNNIKKRFFSDDPDVVDNCFFSVDDVDFNADEIRQDIEDRFEIKGAAKKKQAAKKGNCDCSDFELPDGWTIKADQGSIQIRDNKNKLIALDLTLCKVIAKTKKLM